MNNSGYGKGTCFMWIGSLFSIWNHINNSFWKIRNVECNSYLKLQMNICVWPTYSVMNARLAVQLLITIVSKVLFSYLLTYAARTAKFCSMFDKFFNIMNISRTATMPHKLKPFNATFSSTDDPQFSWLKNYFLKYFEEQLKKNQEHIKNLGNRKCLYHHN